MQSQHKSKKAKSDVYLSLRTSFGSPRFVARFDRGSELDSEVCSSFHLVTEKQEPSRLAHRYRDHFLKLVVFQLVSRSKVWERNISVSEKVEFTKVMVTWKMLENANS